MYAHQPATHVPPLLHVRSDVEVVALFPSLVCFAVGTGRGRRASGQEGQSAPVCRFFLSPSPLGPGMAQLRELLDADRATLFLVDAASGQLWSKVADGSSELRLPMGRGIAGHVASTGEVVSVAGASPVCVCV